MDAPQADHRCRRAAQPGADAATPVADVQYLFFVLVFVD